jgi:hypothetical protein
MSAPMEFIDAAYEDFLWSLETRMPTNLMEAIIFRGLTHDYRPHVSHDLAMYDLALEAVRENRQRA